MTEKQFVEMIGPKATENYKKSNILASITVAQACLESGYGSTDLAKNANNLFGMKTSLSGNTWQSVWDGSSKYTKVTNEEYVVGKVVQITADFRKYPTIDKSIEDHSLYLSQAKNGAKLRYQGLVGEKDYKKAIQIIKDGGYATDSKYVAKICSLIERWNLTQYDNITVANNNSNSDIKKEKVSIKINQNNNFGTHNTTARSGKIEYIVIHYVGATGNAKDNIEYYNQKSTTEASADFYVDHNGDIYQYNPDPSKRYCWAIGGGKQSPFGGSLYGIAKNANCVSIEMCVKNSSSNKNPNSPGWTLSNETFNGTISLTKYLMKLYGISASKVIRHYDVNGKYCPGIVGWNAPSGSETKWNEFKKLIGDSSSVVVEETPKEVINYYVRKTWEDKKSQTGAFQFLENAKKQCAEGYTVFDVNGKVIYENKKSNSKSEYKVKVTVDALNYRQGPSKKDQINGVIKDRGIYTIVEEKGGWGRLKSGAGWIMLEYTQKI